MAKKRSGQERESKTLCLKKSLIISKQECAQWQEGAAQLEQGYVQWREKAAQLEKENQAPKEKLGTNSRNSSKPPSQDPFCRSRPSLDSQVARRSVWPSWPHKGVLFRG